MTFIGKFFHERTYSGEPMKIYDNVDNLLKSTVNTDPLNVVKYL